MRSTVLSVGPPRTHVVVLDRDDAAVDRLLDFAREQRLRTASLTAIGGFAHCTLAYFDIDAREYRDIPVDEQVEVLSLTGDIVCGDDEDWSLHAHAVVGRRDGTTRGGHLQRAVVRPTLEVMVTESPRRVRKRYDSASGLALIDLSAVSPSGGPGAGPPG